MPSIELLGFVSVASIIPDNVDVDGPLPGTLAAPTPTPLLMALAALAFGSFRLLPFVEPVVVVDVVPDTVVEVRSIFICGARLPTTPPTFCTGGPADITSCVVFSTDWPAPLATIPCVDGEVGTKEERPSILSIADSAAPTPPSSSGSQ